MATPSDSGSASQLSAKTQAELAPAACRAELEQLNQSLFEKLLAGNPVGPLLAARSDHMDSLLRKLWRHFLGDRYAGALVAVGGYGRGELHPGSDVDLLILLGAGGKPESDESIGQLIRFLWDLKLTVGHAVRTVSQCVEQARDDVTVVTNLMEARLLAGSEILLQQMVQAISSNRIWQGKAYFEAKLEEQKQRYRKFDDTAYNLEPNVKEGPGGLRDIQTVGWVALRHYGIRQLEQLAQVGFTTPGETRALLKGKEHLSRVRFALHMLAGKSEERLLFQYQRELATMFGYEENEASNSGVEQFMQAYFRVVIMLERLNERLLQYFSEDILHADDNAEPQTIDAHFQARKGYLEVRHDGVFRENPVALLLLFRVLQENTHLLGVRASTLRLIRRDRMLIDQGFRVSEAARRAFVDILEHPTAVSQSLTLMNRYGVLVRYLPVFDKIVGRMQYDLFHVYTVDQHTLFVVRNLTALGSEQSRQNTPLAYETFQRIEKPTLLYLGGFFHDIAKGRGGDHSELGAQDAREFCQQHGFSQAEGELVAWLVQNHLLMSVTAQRRDISDPLVVHEFANAVGQWERLDHLYLLTIADISGTSPKLWNAWKGRLLAELYEATRYALRRGLESPVERDEKVDDNKAAAVDRLRSAGLDENTMEQVWQAFPAEYFRRNAAEQIAWHTLAISGLRLDDLPLVLARELPRWGTTEIFVYSRDSEGLFATVTSVLDYLGLDVVDAKVFTSLNNMSLDTFQVMDQQGRPLGDPYRLARLRARIRDTLMREPLRPIEVKRTNVGKLRHFSMSPKVAVTEDRLNHCSVIEVVCVDRPGLLSDVAHVFLDFGLRVHDARIATFGEKVEDFFRVTDQNNHPLGDTSKVADLKRALIECLEPENHE